jgi:shikimate dehydrogenase
MHLSLRGKKTVILGTGGTAKTARAVAQSLGPSPILSVSRTKKEGAIDYGELYREHSDAEIIINTTPVGMYPNNYDAPIELDKFTRLEGVLDAIYNPIRTPLVLDALERGITAEGGLYMLVVQAVYAAELFADRKIESEKTDQVFKEILNSKRNIVLSGMSLAGKTTLGTLLAKKLDRVLEDTDQMIIRKEQRPITEIFATDGEKYFRDLETEMARTLAPQTGLVIATGGGAILRQENVDALKKNGCIIFLDRPFNQILPADDRPLANTKEKVAALLEKRYPIYKATCDESITNDLTPEEGIAKILAALQNV